MLFFWYLFCIVTQALIIAWFGIHLCLWTSGQAKPDKQTASAAAFFAMLGCLTTLLFYASKLTVLR